MTDADAVTSGVTYVSLPTTVYITVPVVEGVMEKENGQYVSEQPVDEISVPVAAPSRSSTESVPSGSEKAPETVIESPCDIDEGVAEAEIEPGRFCGAEIETIHLSPESPTHALPMNADAK